MLSENLSLPPLTPNSSSYLTTSPNLTQMYQQVKECKGLDRYAYASTEANGGKVSELRDKPCPFVTLRECFARAKRFHDGWLTIRYT